MTLLKAADLQSMTKSQIDELEKQNMAAIDPEVAAHLMSIKKDAIHYAHQLHAADPSLSMDDIADLVFKKFHR